MCSSSVSKWIFCLCTVSTVLSAVRNFSSACFSFSCAFLRLFFVSFVTCVASSFSACVLSSMACIRFVSACLRRPNAWLKMALARATYRLSSVTVCGSMVVTRL